MATTRGIPGQAADERVAILRAGSLISATLSGSYALVAFVIGSALEFGVGLALCAAFWIAADFFTAPVRAEPARTTGRHAPVTSPPGSTACGSGHILSAGGCAQPVPVGRHFETDSVAA